MRHWPVVAGRVGIALAAAGAAASLAQVAMWDQGPYSTVIAVETVAMLPLAMVGASAVRAAPRNIVGWLLLAGGTFMPVATASYLYARAAFDAGRDLPLASLAGWLDGWPWVPAQLAVALFAPLLFPDGRLPSRRWRPVIVIDVVICALLVVSTLFDPGLLDWPHRVNPTGMPGGFGDVAHALMVVIALVAPMTLVGAIGFELRQRGATDPAARAVFRLVRPAVWLLTLSWWVCVLVLALGRPSLYALPFESLGMTAVGITCWVAIRRYGLFDARSVVRRGLVYGALSACVLAVYGVVTVLLVRLGAEHAATPVALVAAVAIAVPLHARLQGVANRLVYGVRDDPVAALLALGDQLEGSAATDEILPASVRSLRRTLRLRHVAVSTASGIVGEDGSAGGGQVEEFPLVHAGERVGTLRVGLDPGDSRLDAQRKALLTGLTRPVAAAVRADSLRRDLAVSHERLVSATEEERKRLRRDLHDGLGPTLSSAVLGASRAHALLATRPDAAAQQLDLLTRQLQEAVADVRRLVYDLRPPALDHLGLVGALREHAESVGHFSVIGPDALTLPAATEVATYRIAMEAMTNAARHGRLREGTVEIVTQGDALRLTVTDDGVGLPHGFRGGVGITSMRERAAELGGSFDIAAQPDGGTKVEAWLPLQTA